MVDVGSHALYYSLVGTERKMTPVWSRWRMSRSLLNFGGRRCRLNFMRPRQCGNRSVGDAVLSRWAWRAARSGRQLLVGLQPAEALGGLEHGGGGPAQAPCWPSASASRCGRPADGAHHVLDDVGAGQRAAQFVGQASRLTVRISSRPSRMLAATPGASCSSRRARLRISFSALSASSSSQAWRSARRTEACSGFGQALHDVAGLVDLAALDRRVAPEGPPDRLGQRLGAIDDEQPADRRIEPALDQVVEQRLDHRRVLGGALDQRRAGASSPLPSMPTAATRTGPRRCGCRRSGSTRRSSCDRSAAIQACKPFGRQRHEAARGRRLGHAGARSAPARHPRAAAPPGRTGASRR